MWLLRDSYLVVGDGKVEHGLNISSCTNSRFPFGFSPSRLAGLPQNMLSLIHDASTTVSEDCPIYREPTL